MGFQPRTRSRRDVDHEFTKPLREKRKDRLHRGRRIGKSAEAQKHIATIKEASEGTLQRLHTIGSQKFASSPFSQHFDLWLINAKVILSEFESNPNISVDEQYVSERSQILSTVEQQLERKRRSETALDEDVRNLSECKNRLEIMKKEYVATARQIETRKNREIKLLYRIIDGLKRDQDEVIRMKTGFFRGISEKEREEKEIEITQRLADEQRALELATLNFKEAKGKLRDDYETKSAPVSNQMKKFQKKLEDAETDDSLEDRWFACEALIDAVNSLLQRKRALDASTVKS